MTYEYLCEACGHRWEAQQSISEDPLKDCPHCGQPRAKRQISRGGGFILKGGGWYSDLYSSPGTSKEKDTGKDQAPSGAKESSKKSESSSSDSSTASDQSSNKTDTKSSSASATKS